MSATPTLAQQIEQFLAYLRARKSAATVRAYGGDLAQLLNFANEKQDLDAEFLLSYLRRFAETPITRARKLSTLRAFFRYAKSQDWIDRDPTELLEAPYRRKRLPKALNLHQAAALLDQGAVGRTPKRDRALLELAYSAGLRASELVGVDLDHIDFNDRSIRVLGKGNKERMAFFGKTCESAIQDYLEGERVAPIRNNPLFTNASGGRLTTRTVQNIVKRWARSVGLPSSVTPHTLRHTFATHLLDGGADLKSVQQLLGHASVATTQVYTHISIERLKEAVDKAHPQSS